jgi:hypothetical protein
MDEDLENRVIETMTVVNSLRFHTTDGKNKAGYRVNDRCDCGTKQVGPVHNSSKRPLMRPRNVIMMRELPRSIQIMLHINLKIIQTRFSVSTLVTHVL